MYMYKVATGYTRLHVHTHIATQSAINQVSIWTQSDDFQEQSNAAVDCACQTDDTTENVDTVNLQGRLCEGMVDEKFRPLVLKCSGVFKDSAGK